MLNRKNKSINMLLSVVLILSFFAPIEPAYAEKHSAHTKTSAPANNDGGATESNASQPDGQEAPEADATTPEETNNLANLEAILNIIANGLEILGFIIGGPLLLGVPVGFVMLFLKGKRKYGLLLIFAGPLICLGALAAPGCINWLVASARDAGLFN